ncbi:MAG: hypothetical protein ACRDRU_14545 [Pseudonocardiaceae bacterium]
MNRDRQDGRDVTEIVFDVHVTGACVIILEEDAATVLFEALRTWLGR